MENFKIRVDSFCPFPIGTNDRNPKPGTLSIPKTLRSILTSFPDLNAKDIFSVPLRYFPCSFIHHRSPPWRRTAAKERESALRAGGTATRTRNRIAVRRSISQTQCVAGSIPGGGKRGKGERSMDKIAHICTAHLIPELINALQSMHILLLVKSWKNYY